MEASQGGGESRTEMEKLRDKTRTQAQQILTWRRVCKMQEMLINHLHKEKNEQFKALSSKLLLFESRLIRKQKDISGMLNHRETIIEKQRILIESLSSRLVDNGLELPASELQDAALGDFDSLNDSDSAVVLEDEFFAPKATHTIARSISDAIDPNLKYTSIRRSNCFLRRPEVLETVYSVEEDVDNDDDHHRKADAIKKREYFAIYGKTPNRVDGEAVQKDRSLEEKLCAPPTWPPPDEDKAKTNQVKTYNRVMSNHRSVTKPKDVKYKRINKAKSKSLEELRGRLKNWVEQGSKLGLTLEHSHSYA